MYLTLVILRLVGGVHHGTSGSQPGPGKKGREGDGQINWALGRTASLRISVAANQKLCDLLCLSPGREGSSRFVELNGGKWIAPIVVLKMDGLTSKPRLIRVRVITGDRHKRG